MDKKSKIVVVCGGNSSEREVSLKSGRTVYDALLKYGYSNVIYFDLYNGNLVDLLNLNPDICYLTLHGKGGEDGKIQGALDICGIPYTGSNTETSAICMNKIITKHILSYYNIPTAKYRVYNFIDFCDLFSISDNLLSNIGLPLVLKTPCEGSSLGVYIINNQDELIPSLEEIKEYGDIFLAEKFVDGVEVTLPIIGNDKPICLPIIEIDSQNAFYSYDAKYIPGLTKHIIPPNLPQNIINKINDIGIKTYKCLGCKGVSRIDFILDKDNNPMVMEINTLPGMTKTSLLPDSAFHSGIDLPNLVNEILNYGIQNNQK